MDQKAAAQVCGKALHGVPREAAPLDEAFAGEHSIAIRLEGGGGGHGEPVSIGVPFPRGALPDTSALSLVGKDGSALDSQWQVLSRWPDGSIRWALLDFVREEAAGASRELRVFFPRGAERRAPTRPSLSVAEEEGRLVIDTGTCKFSLATGSFGMGASLRAAGTHEAFQWTCELVDARGRVRSGRVERIETEVLGPLRATLLLTGKFPRPWGACLDFEARVSLYAGTGLVRVEFTLRNPQAARHRGGLWDLGDPGSRWFRDLSIRIEGPASNETSIAWRVEPGKPVGRVRGGHVEIFQASSGGENWRSRNHVDRHGNVPLGFRGYLVREGGKEEAGLRSSPVVSMGSPRFRVSAALARFWEQFPKAMEVEDGRIRMGLFPREHAGLFELQGGEQKTHAFYLLFEPVPIDDDVPLEWVSNPTVLAVDPRHMSKCEAVGAFLPFEEDPHDDYLTLVQSCVSGPDSFFAKREVIDEYGWRSFGDVYADHENLYYPGERPVISHYNNQYDLLQGLLLHFARTGRPEWFEVARDLALHVIDIDIYHTRRDKAAYNGGLFWHTDHYSDAGRATHRTYSSLHPTAKAGRPYGGGPSSEHNYTSGLLHFHYLTGNPLARSTVLTLAEWVIEMDDGKKSPLGFLDSGPTGHVSSTAEPHYHGPGRGPGNSVNALLDAFRLTGERRYLQKAEELVRRSIHPKDDVSSRRLGDLEMRWSYLVFLQVLGKFIDLKVELGERDSMYEYARRSLVEYALWMLENEVPYMQKLDEVEFPTETWPAHDVRKSVVFDLAAKHGPPELRDAFLEKAEFFFKECMTGLSSFSSRTRTRPLAILLGNGVSRGLSLRHPPKSGSPLSRDADFGLPVPFASQEERVKVLLRTARGRAKLAAALLRPAVVFRILSHLVRRLRERVRP